MKDKPVFPKTVAPEFIADEAMNAFVDLKKEVKYIRQLNQFL